MKLDAYLEREQISRAEFAKMTGASVSAISRWLNGSRRPDAEMMEWIRGVTRGQVTFADFYQPKRNGK